MTKSSNPFALLTRHARGATSREKKIASLAVALVLVYVVFSFCVGPSVRANAQVNKEIAVARVKLKKYLTLIGNKDLLRQRYRIVYGSDFVQNEHGNEIVRTLSELESYAKSSQIRLLDMRPEMQGKKKNVRIDIKSEGSIEAYTKFLYDLEHMSTSLHVQRASLNARPHAGELEGFFVVVDSSN